MRRSRSRLPGSTPVWLCTVVLAAAAVVLLRTGALGTAPAPGAPHAPWLLLVAALAVAETVIVHVEFRREAHTFGFNELVLAGGLLAVGGRELVLAQAVATVVAMLARRQVPLKFAFNVAQYSLATATTVAVLGAVCPRPHLLDLPTALAVLGATVAGSTVSWVAILAAIALVDRPPSRGEALEVLLVGYLGVLANAGLGLSLLLLLREGPLALLCAAPAAAVAIASYRAYLASRQRREHLAFLLEATSALQSGGDPSDTSGGWATVLRTLRTALRAESAVLLVAPSGAGGTAGDDGWLLLRTAAVGDEGVARFERVPAEAAAALRPSVDGLHDRRRGAGDAAWLAARDWPGALSATISDEARVLGHLLLGPRVGANAHYAAADLVLVEALANQVSGVLETGRLEQALRQITVLKEQMQHEAWHDPLTALANRALFRDRLEAAVGAPDGVSVLLVDLDDFKAVNDELGHAAGDRLLRAVGDRMREVVRDLDTPARLGGDEFAAVLPGCSPDDAHEVAARLLAALSAPVQLDGARVPVRASVGIATLGGEHLTPEELLRRADLALYAVKAEGKTGARAWSPSLTSAMERRTVLTATLPAAIAGGEIVCHYQPVLDLGSERVTALEALVRWEHPERGLLGPDAFLALAEDAGWIHEVGERVLRLACLEYAALLDAFPQTPELLHVNISALQMEPRLPEAVARALADAGLPGERLVLEVTGTTAVADAPSTRAVMEAVCALGAVWALDDFGTGFAAIDRLADLPVSMVKLPRPMVRGLGSPRGARLVAGTLALAREVGLDVVAEGVETRDEADALLAAGCRQAQGHLWAAAMQPVELGRWMRRGAQAGVSSPRS
ncbi:diguanylate cyclase (GGDEF)-like protein [Motilibacter peucedani]|uniref:Diguanylate cyclase (GGDEF)-like protein n=1 Tax=Motilibacter peucedani TaxID=598650 RepID=A0A420XK20_9ACTN|nr:EAL domain-containing protein [Motilibacter peucedani]RKS68491.1 diguanylate cyclase (GGDEF)-like protein [Motilibacter peucedani]